MRAKQLGFGVAGVILAIVAFVVPAGSLFVVWAALFAATLAALLGDRVLATVTIAVCAVNVLLVNSLVALFGLVSGGDAAVGRVGHPALLALTVFMFIAPMAALIAFAAGRSPLTRARLSRE